MKILMTGGTGLIGSRFKELTNLSEVLAPGSVEFDITDKEAVESFINKTKPDILINATPVGMYPNIDKSPIDEGLLSKEMVKDVLREMIKSGEIKL